MNSDYFNDKAIWELDLYTQNMFRKLTLLMNHKEYMVGNLDELPSTYAIRNRLTCINKHISNIRQIINGLNDTSTYEKQVKLHLLKSIRSIEDDSFNTSKCTDISVQITHINAMQYKLDGMDELIANYVEHMTEYKRIYKINNETLDRFNEEVNKRKDVDSWSDAYAYIAEKIKKKETDKDVSDAVRIKLELDAVDNELKKQQRRMDDSTEKEIVECLNLTKISELIDLINKELQILSEIKDELADLHNRA